MKTGAIFAAVLFLIASACTSPRAAVDAAAKPRSDLGVRSTRWGELHEFSPVGPLRESKFVPARGNGAALNGSAVVELLIGADGKVLDAAVAQSSGDRNVDAAALAAFAGDRFPRIPGHTSSSPYVARHRVVFKGSSGLAMKELIGWPAAQ